MTPLTDPEFNASRRASGIAEFVADADAGDVPPGLLGAPALGDARGRVAALPARRRARLRRRPATPGDLRMGRRRHGEPTGPRGSSANRAAGSTLLPAAPGLAGSPPLAWQRRRASDACRGRLAGGARGLPGSRRATRSQDDHRRAARLRCASCSGVAPKAARAGRHARATPRPRRCASRGAELLRRLGRRRRRRRSASRLLRILESLCARTRPASCASCAREGPQPAVDVRAGLPLASELVGPGST